MSLQAHITTENGTPWLYITRPGPSSGTRFCILDMPLDLRTKHSTKLEIDFAFERSGMSRPDLYDIVRQYQHEQRKAHRAA